MPNAWAPDAEPILVWGPSLFTPTGSAQKTFFDNLRALFTYLLWAGFIYSIYDLAKYVMNDAKIIVVKADKIL